MQLERYIFFTHTHTHHTHIHTRHTHGTHTHAAHSHTCTRGTHTRTLTHARTRTHSARVFFSSFTNLRILIYLLWIFVHFSGDAYLFITWQLCFIGSTFNDRNLNLETPEKNKSQKCIDTKPMFNTTNKLFYLFLPLSTVWHRCFNLFMNLNLSISINFNDSYE